MAARSDAEAIFA